ncbi:MAG: hypothetical protein ACJAY9_000799 [Flavobacteriales bacterium]|jgi:hypothetical protein
MSEEMKKFTDEVAALKEATIKSNESLNAKMVEQETKSKDLEVKNEALTQEIVAEKKARQEFETEAKAREALSLRPGSHGSKSLVDEAETKKSLEYIAGKFKNKETADLNQEEVKAIRFSDATTTGGFIDSPLRMGEIDINKQPNTIILNDIDFMGAVGSNDGSVAWEGFDESLVDLYEANEMDAAQLSEAVKKSLIKLSMEEVKAKMILSSKVIQNALAGGNQLSTLQKNLTALDSRYRRKLAAKVFQNIIDAAIKGDIGKIASTTDDAPADNAARKDLRLLSTNLKVDYIPEATMYVSRKFLNTLFSTTVSDGHLPLEQFVTTPDGVTRFVTPEKAFAVRVFEHNQIGNYKSLVDGVATISTDYVDGADNTGKLLAIIADFKTSYKLIPSSIGTIGYDASITNILDGAVPAGKSSYAAQGIVLREGVKVFYGK